MTTPTNPPAGDMTAPSEGRRTRLGEVIYGAMFEVQIDLRYGGAEKAEYIADAVRRALEEAEPGDHPDYADAALDAPGRRDRRGRGSDGMTATDVRPVPPARDAVTLGYDEASRVPEGEHVAREVFTADGIPFVRCSCSTAKSPTSHRWLSEHVPNGGVAELQAVVKRQAEGAKA